MMGRYLERWSVSRTRFDRICGKVAVVFALYYGLLLRLVSCLLPRLIIRWLDVGREYALLVLISFVCCEWGHVFGLLHTRRISCSPTLGAFVWIIIPTAYLGWLRSGTARLILSSRHLLLSQLDAVDCLESSIAQFEIQTPIAQICVDGLMLRPRLGERVIVPHGVRVFDSVHVGYRLVHGSAG